MRISNVRGRFSRVRISNEKEPSPDVRAWRPGLETLDHRVHRTPACGRILADQAVDVLSQQVGVAGVPSVFLDQVADQAAHAGPLITLTQRMGRSIPPSAITAASRSRAATASS